MAEEATWGILIIAVILITIFILYHFLIKPVMETFGNESFGIQNKKAPTNDKPTPSSNLPPGSKSGTDGSSGGPGSGGGGGGGGW
ncbi:hypothetical protein B6U80_01635 [Candidatus Pacearchaeota archaeon ex4484_26]|nr:MAG: hypothetical protein B6U80_01635 [Candidatus Pacearchaeota archaeon ex4484_26]